MDPEERTLLRVLASVFLQNARPDRAIVLLAALDVLEPDQPDTLRMLAVARLRAQQAEAALEVLERLALTGAVDAVFHLLRAQALTALARAPEAAAAMQAFLALRDQTPADTAALTGD